MTEPEEDFAAMFEASTKPKRFEKGQTLEGTIVAIGPEVAFVDVGGKGEATIEIDELKDANGELDVAVGDRIQAMVVSTEEGLILSRKLARSAATSRQLEDAFRTGLPVEGRVERTVKGGYEVRIGRQRAFCPISQIDTLRTDPSAHEGHVYEFRITEYKEGGRNIVVSRRALLEERQQASAAEIRRAIVAGAVMKGRVASVREFGAFVDLGGGVQGLLHVSEMGWSRVADASEVVKPGEEITGIEGLAHASTFAPTGRSDGWSAQVAPGKTGSFEILSIDLEKKRIGVALVPEGSARAGGMAPSQPEIVPGARLTGKVERHEKFGVFVFLAPGRTGLIPLGETGVVNEANVARELPVGGDVDVIVLEVDSSGRRIRLSAKAVQGAREADEVREYTERRDSAPAEGFGSLADKFRDALKPRQK